MNMINNFLLPYHLLNISHFIDFFRVRKLSITSGIISRYTSTFCYILLISICEVDQLITKRQACVLRQVGAGTKLHTLYQDHYLDQHIQNCACQLRRAGAGSNTCLCIV